jgi:magnesium transporter
MMDAFASIISNNLNSVMKILATLTITVALPGTVGTFYGMNVALPFQDHPYAFGIVLGIAFSLTLLAVFIFAKRDWF